MPLRTSTPMARSTGRASARRSYYIFVVSRRDYGSYVLEPETIFSALAARSVWLISHGTRHRSRMTNGDHIVFYLAGNGRRCFVATASICGEPRSLTTDELGFAQALGLAGFELAIDLRSVRRWKRGVPIAALYDAVGFIKDRRYPGHPLRMGIVKLSREDFDTIVAARKQQL